MRAVAKNFAIDANIIRYELGNYLGGGVAGVVYEAERCGANQHFALKILNPVGYKLERKATLKQVRAR